MITKRTFSSNLHYFSPFELSMGKDQKKKILQISGNNKNVTAFYRNTVASIEFAGGQIANMRCDCGQAKYCRHLAGLVLVLLDNPEILNQVEKDDSVEGQMGKSVGAIDLLPLLEFGKINTYREVLYPDSFLSDIETSEYDYDFEMSDFFFSPSIEIYTHHDNVLYLAMSDLLLDEDEGEEVIVQLLWEENKLFIKCRKCNMHSDQLCEHQAWWLTGVDIPWIELFLQRKMNVAAQYENLTYFTPFSLQFLQTHFDVGFYENEQIYPRAKENLILMDRSSLEDYDEIFGSPLKPLQIEAWLDEMYGKEIENPGTAIVWSLIDGRVKVEYVEGRLSKDGSKLTAHIRKIEVPAGIPPSVQYELMRVNGKTVSFDNDLSYLEISQQLTYLLEHAREWKDYIHYLNTDRNNYSDQIRKKNLVLFEFADEPLQMEVKIDEDQEAIFVSAQLDMKSKQINKKEKIWLYPLFCVAGNKAYIYSDISVKEHLIDVDMGAEMKFLFHVKRKDNARKMVSTMVNRFRVQPERLDDAKVEFLDLPRKTIHLSQRKNQILFLPYLSENADKGLQFEILKEFCRPATQDPYYIVAPDPDTKKDFLEWLRNLHPEMDRRTEPLGFVSLPIHDFRKNQWFLTFSEICDSAGVVVEGWEELEGFSFSPHRAEIVQHLKSGTDWFDIHFTIQFGDIIVPQKDWIKAVVKGEKSVLLEDGTYGIIPEEWRLKMIDLLRSAEVVKEEIKLSKLHFNIVDQYLEVDEESEIRREIEEKKSRLLHFKEMKTFEIPEKINADLRPYQQEGFQWLKFLNEYGFGGCLADDMGLGKTLQVLTLLTDIKDDHSAASLIVVPRSLIHNWGAEVEKFSPEMTYMIHHGVQREKNHDDFDAYDMIISTYDTVANDVAWLKDYRFHYVVLDESQAIKNPSSQRYRAMIQLSANHKITMTGTPIENSTMDLFAQFNFINPGLLGNQTQFRKRFADPIDKDDDEQAKSLLQKIVHPFLLRRTKRQVARDLPERTESILYCDMDHEQRTLYEKMKNQIRTQLLSEENLEQNKIKVLEGLLKLRQICNSPALLNGKDGGKKKFPESSVKIDMLMEQLREVVDGEDHSVLVFSQFTSMLALVRNQLDNKGYKYSYLDGSTRQRQEVIDSFNDDPAKRIFLLSLKAGNTGLNLTKADFVYLLDPWWNPAVEAQAIDRTHRIGQTNPVFAYRLICKDTVEEKIIHLQAKKNQLADDLIQTDENVFKTLNRDALISLFE